MKRENKSILDLAIGKWVIGQKRKLRVAQGNRHLWTPHTVFSTAQNTQNQISLVGRDMKNELAPHTVLDPSAFYFH